ncbi:hypothetical protein Esi_0080_0021 [Ectocarpus siliculosus]|uniref:Uncharacterized protein n=1 Tax=Ectocarpus siliculosus TaxID=2880 RepID=D7G794_ECTSI|nr:hypothetical protein Esi_0080_0021 [Ectocarpus siliculosus]|eukprot:CBJ27645.1 hypothetical protein Esi_0080_0021 [Ectocarpus siliculosus]
MLVLAMPSEDVVVAAALLHTARHMLLVSAVHCTRSLTRSSVPFCTQDFIAAKEARIAARAAKAASVEANKEKRGVEHRKAKDGDRSGKASGAAKKASKAKTAGKQGSKV